ncbi:MAG: nucleoside diphosphate kinase regulator [Syntrophorhabdaceae bacterium]|nr:nucleoside diphosphate kinase regulator [Syntrophorhabdaceae bacterium]MDD4197393.1 nucleoside diphosphate kinase regulator [Syntrophorhabdaceae bacterium]
MAKSKIFITRHDLERLRTIIDVHGGPEAPYLEKLKKELRRAVVKEPNKIPGDVVTMNSIVRIKDVKTGEEHSFILVFPSKAGVAGKAVSILAPMGIALIGYREGDVLEWELPTGKVNIQIDEIIYQPERLGNYDL